MANREYKDSVFTLLFSDKAKLIELYNAIEGTNYPPDTEIKINTLEDVLFMNRKNDISFTIDDKFVVLVEHQSTMNYNMPLRMFMYMARVYESIIDSTAVYREKLIKIPTPEFIVLYNGTSEQPKNKTLKLSDAFIDKSKIKAEIQVEMININYGKSDIIAKSQNLKGYSYFVYKVREYLEQNKDGSYDEKLDSAIASAISDCVKQNMLVDFFEKNGSEVMNMLFTEFDIDVAKTIWREEALEEGMEKGRAEGIKEGINSIITNMKALGMSEEQIKAIVEM